MKVKSAALDEGKEESTAAKQKYRVLLQDRYKEDEGKEDCCKIKVQRTSAR